MVRADDVGGGEGADVGHEHEGHGDQHVLVGQGQDELEKYTQLTGADVTGTLDDGLGNTGQSRDDDHSSKGDVEPQVHELDALHVIQHAGLETVQLAGLGQQQGQTVQQTGVLDDGAHSVNGHQAGDEAGQQVQVADQLGDLGVAEAHIQRQQIGNADRQDDGQHGVLKGIPNGSLGNLLGEQIHIVCKGPGLSLRILEALDDRLDDGGDDHTQRHQQGRDQGTDDKQSSFPVSLRLQHRDSPSGYIEVTFVDICRGRSPGRYLA